MFKLFKTSYLWKVKSCCISKLFCSNLGFPNGNQALLLLRSCGSLLPELLPHERTALAHTMWTKLKDAGMFLSKINRTE